MRPTLTFLLSLATLTTALSAQAPIERAANPRPVPGVYLRTGHNSYVHTVASDADHTELRVERGVANIRVDHPAEGSQILVDLPGGQVALVKDGFYTFNAETNTVRVMDGEAAAFANSNSDKEIKVKSSQEVVFDAHPRAADFDRSRSQTDLIPGGQYAPGEYVEGGYGGGDGYIGEAAPYGYGFYGGYPYYGYGYGYPYGYGWGYPYGYGLGLGFGYYGGWGGYRGGFGGWRGGGFHGGGFHPGFHR